jgi:thioredoxin reductase
MPYDAIIVGGGPAGLSAALVLGRCCRRVLVCDAGRPRNRASRGLHGFLTRDGILPEELRRIGCDQLRPYDVELRAQEVVGVTTLDPGFEIELEDGVRETSTMLLLATGVIDNVPEIPGIEQFYGRSIFHCPYCDGWEVRHQPVAVYGRGRNGVGLALSLTTWTGDIVLCTDGDRRLSDAGRARLAAQRIAIRHDKIERLAGEDGQLERIDFVGGGSLGRRAMFFSTGQRQCSDLAARLGCRFTSKGAVKTDRLENTGIAGLYVAGDASRDVQLAIIAAAEGARAAFAINTALQEMEGKRVEPAAW